MKKTFAVILASLLVFAGTAVPVSAQTRDAANLDEALNYPGDELHFVSEGDYPWVVDGDCAKSTNQGIDGSYYGDAPCSSVGTTVTASAGDVVAFEFSVSSERMDKLRLFIDGEEVWDWWYSINDGWQTGASGELDWTGTSYELTAGLHTIEWKYLKDSSSSAGEDTAWLDNVHIGAPLAVESVEVTDSVEFPAGAYRPRLEWTVFPRGAYNKDVTFESSDESIATVDEKGIVRGISEGSAVITVRTDDGGFTDECQVTVTEAQAPVYLYGMLSAESLYYSEGPGWYHEPCTWSTFDASNPEESLFEFGVQNDSTGAMTAIGAAEYVDGYVYGFTGYGAYPEELFKMSFEDLDNGVIDPEYYGFNPDSDKYLVLDMAYDYSTETMYYLAADLYTMGTVLFTVDLETGESSFVGELSSNDPVIGIGSSALCYSLAISTDGIGYVMLAGYGATYYGDGALCEIDLDTAELIRTIGVTGDDCFQQQSMTYDHNTGVIYWAQWDSPYEPGNNLRVIDPETGKSETCGVINGDGGCAILGLFIPYDADTPQPPQYEMGDVNMDGSVTADDALLTLRSYMGLHMLSEEQQQLADVNENGEVNADDALIILRMTLEL